MILLTRRESILGNDREVLRSSKQLFVFFFNIFGYMLRRSICTFSKGTPRNTCILILFKTLVYQKDRLLNLPQWILRISKSEVNPIISPSFPSFIFMMSLNPREGSNKYVGWEVGGRVGTRGITLLGILINGHQYVARDRSSRYPTFNRTINTCHTRCSFIRHQGQMSYWRTRPFSEQLIPLSDIRLMPRELLGQEYHPHLVSFGQFAAHEDRLILRGKLEYEPHHILPVIAGYLSRETWRGCHRTMIGICDNASTNSVHDLLYIVQRIVQAQQRHVNLGSSQCNVATFSQTRSICYNWDFIGYKDNATELGVYIDGMDKTNQNLD